MHRLAERTSAQAYVMPVPFFANSVEDRKVLLEQRGVREVFAMADAASLKLVGIGSVDPQGAARVVGDDGARRDRGDRRRRGRRRDARAHFFDPEGRTSRRR